MSSNSDFCPVKLQDINHPVFLFLSLIVEVVSMQGLEDESNTDNRSEEIAYLLHGIREALKEIACELRMIRQGVDK